MAKAKAKPKKTAGSLSEGLARLDGLIRTKVARRADSLAPPAKKAAIDKLAPLFGGKVPEDVRAWFSWHDGFKPGTYEALIPDTSWSAMSCKEVANVHGFLCGQPPDEIMQPWRDQWVPLFENGGGDHLCYDTQTGALIIFWHDDASRPKDYKSLAALVAAMEKGYARMKAPSTFTVPAIKTWKKMAVRDIHHLASLPLGTLLTYFARLPMGPRHTVCLKLGDNRWITDSHLSVDQAMRELRAFGKKPPAESDGYYEDDNNLHFYLGQYRKTVKLGTS